jgi:hypothetical protein
MGNGNKVNGLGTGPLAGMGDIAPPSVDPMERYFQIVRGQVQLPRRGWVVNPQWTPEMVPGMEQFQKVFEEHELPRRWQQMEDAFVLLQRGRFMVKSPNWIEAPITAEMNDVVNETAVAVVAANTTIVSYTVPDRCVAAFKAFGQNLTDGAQWGTVIWNIFVNKRPIRTYQDFTWQRGSVAVPTPFPKPITLKGRDVITVSARTAGGAVSAIARLSGFVIAAQTVTQDGSYKDWNSR